jgi:hypothetical protein
MMEQGGLLRTLAKRETAGLDDYPMPAVMSLFAIEAVDCSLIQFHFPASGLSPAFP